MGAIQGAINQMITSAAIGVGATQKIKADVKEAEVKADKDQDHTENRPHCAAFDTFQHEDGCR